MRYSALIITWLGLFLMAGCAFGQSRGGSVAVPQGMEIPQYAEDEDIVVHTGYTASYNHHTLLPNWVAYELTAAELEGGCEVQRNYSRDPDVAFPKASREDYANTGWDKGHMAARADMKWSEQALLESDYFTNICPQDHDLNAGMWNRIEGIARHAARRFGTVYIVTGPLFVEGEDMGTIGQAGVCVPNAFFKTLVVCDSGSYRGVAFVVPNRKCEGRPLDYAHPIDDVEALLGIDLYPRLPLPEVEAFFNWPDWKPTSNQSKGRKAKTKSTRKR